MRSFRLRPGYVALLIAATAILLRLYHRAPTWQSSDASNLPDWVAWAACRRFVRPNHLKDLALYRLGGVQPLVMFAQMRVLRWFGVRVDELTWESSQIVVSAASTYAAYLFANEVAGAAAGLCAAALLAVTPLGIMLGRHLGAPWPYEEGFQYLILFLSIALVRRPKRALRIGLSVALAIYVWVGNQGLGILPVVLYVFAAGYAERKQLETLLEFLRARATPWLLLPLFSLALLLYCTFALRKGHLYHALFHRPHTLGVYVSQWFHDASLAIGETAVYVALALAVVGAVVERRWLSLRHVPFALTLAYALPFWFAIPPGSTLTRGYVMYGVSALLIAACTAAFSPRLRARYAPVLLLWIAFVQVGGALQSTYRLLGGQPFSTRGFQGAYGANNGIKAAAGWIRSRGAPHGAVMSDASGGQGLEPSILDMYLMRPNLAVNDAPNPRYVYAKFATKAARIEYILVSPENHALAAKYFPSFSREVDITNGPNGDVILSVYGKEHVEVPKRLDVAQGDADFAARYSMLCPR
jgi:hypothetical protein